MQTTNHADRADQAGCATFMFAFLNCDLHLIKVCTPFPYSFGNILTPHSKILRGSFEVTLSGKTKSRGQVFRARAD